MQGTFEDTTTPHGLNPQGPPPEAPLRSQGVGGEGGGEQGSQASRRAVGQDNEALVRGRLGPA